MRISDWSSDVCSSDLLVALRAGGDSVDEARGLHLQHAGAGLRIAAQPRDGDQHVVGTVARGNSTQRSGVAGQRLRRIDGGKVAEVAERHRQRQQAVVRSEEHTSALQSPMRNSYAVFCLKTIK